MQIQSLLNSENILLDTSTINNKDDVLRFAAAQLAKNGSNSENIYGALVSRESDGSTALGDGVAIPHGRVAKLSAPYACLIRLENSIDFAAPDGKTVDLVVAMIVPADCTAEHLTLLASLAELLSDDDVTAKIRAAKTSADIATVISA